MRTPFRPCFCLRQVCGSAARPPGTHGPVRRASPSAAVLRAGRPVAGSVVGPTRASRGRPQVGGLLRQAPLQCLVSSPITFRMGCVCVCARGLCGVCSGCLESPTDDDSARSLWPRTGDRVEVGTVGLPCGWLVCEPVASQGECWARAPACEQVFLEPAGEG